VRGEITGPPRYRNVGESQPALGDEQFRDVGWAQGEAGRAALRESKATALAEQAAEQQARVQQLHADIGALQQKLSQAKSQAAAVEEARQLEAVKVQHGHHPQLTRPSRWVEGGAGVSVESEGGAVS
jgi:uncharacterized coiled-coil protein SlyX